MGRNQRDVPVAFRLSAPADDDHFLIVSDAIESASQRFAQPRIRNLDWHASSLEDSFARDGWNLAARFGVYFHVNLIAQENAGKFDLNVHNSSPWLDGLMVVSILGALWLLWRLFLGAVEIQRAVIPWDRLARWFPSAMMFVFLAVYSLAGSNSFWFGFAFLLNLPRCSFRCW